VKKSERKRRLHLQNPRNERLVEPAASLLATISSLHLCLVSQESLLLAIDDIFASVEVSLMRLDTLRLHENLVTEDADQVDRDTLNRC